MFACICFWWLQACLRSNGLRLLLDENLEEQEAHEQQRNHGYYFGAVVQFSWQLQIRANGFEPASFLVLCS